MAVQHSAITDPDIHEPKGVAAASLGQVYVADGAGSGDWYVINAKGFISFSNIAVPLTITYPSSYTKVNPSTTVGGFPRETTEATTSRITYTGTVSKPVRVTANLFIDQSSGSNRDVRLALYKNGSIISATESIVTLITATKVNVMLVSELLAATDDYFEVYIRNEGASGDIKLYSFSLALNGLGIQ